MKIKNILVLGLLFCLPLLKSCDTASTISRDSGGISSSTPVAQKDSFDLFKAIKSLDDWIKENIC